MIEDLPIYIYIFPKILIFLTLTYNKKYLAQKIENQASKLCAEFNADFKTVLVCILALIVFDFYSFEGSKTHFTGEPNIYIYIHINEYIEYCYGVLKL